MKRAFLFLVAWFLWLGVASSHDLMFTLPVDPRDVILKIDNMDCGFDYREWVNKNGGFHLGNDYCTDYGDPVFAAGFGIVIAVYPEVQAHGLGNAIILQHSLDRPIDKEDGTRDNYVYTLYGHLSEIHVHEGESVYAGQTIGAVGHTGGSGGVNHLHFEVKTANTLAIPDPNEAQTYGYHTKDPNLIGFIQPGTFYKSSRWKTIHIHEEPAGSGRAHVHGEEFGEDPEHPGQIAIEAPDPESGAMLQYVPESTEWTNTRISFDLFRGNIDRDSLTGSLLVDLQPYEKSPIYNLGFPFGDVPASEWYAPPIMDGWRRGVFGGVAEGGVFAPAVTTNFAQLFKVLVTGAGRNPSPCVDGERPLPSTAQISFPAYDAENRTPWFCEYYKSALEAGWLSFFFPLAPERGAPDQAPHREEVAALLSRILNLQEMVNESIFSDVLQSNPYMLYIERCRLHGIFNGTEDQSFLPEHEINRAELAAVIQRAFYPRADP